MSKLKGYVPYSLLTVMAAIIALAIAWEPGVAELDRSDKGPIVAATASAADCAHAVWPYVARDCLVSDDARAATRTVRRILIDDNTQVERYAEIALLRYGD